MWYKNICSASFSFVTIHACDRQTGQRDRITTPKTALAYACAVKTDVLVRCQPFPGTNYALCKNSQKPIQFAMFCEGYFRHETSVACALPLFAHWLGAICTVAGLWTGLAQLGLSWYIWLALGFIQCSWSIFCLRFQFSLHISKHPCTTSTTTKQSRSVLDSKQQARCTGY